MDQILGGLESLVVGDVSGDCTDDCAADSSGGTALVRPLPVGFCGDVSDSKSLKSAIT